ncbi:MAG: hypothetical protein UV54_C0001G0030, partial [Candidatus Beckwithbacteria bacterium GW2011_GWA2_43_10]
LEVNRVRAGQADGFGQTGKGLVRGFNFSRPVDKAVPAGERQTAF